MANKLGWNQSHLNNFINKYYHTTNIHYLSKKEAVKVIESLKNIKNHRDNEK